MEKKSEYEAFGEYGIHADDRVRVTVRASSLEKAGVKAVKALKRSRHWGRIGEHNVYVRVLKENDDAKA